MHIFITNDPAGRERNNFQQLYLQIDWTKIHSHNFTSIAYSYK